MYQSIMVLSSYITALYFISVALYFVTCLMSIPVKCVCVTVVRDAEVLHYSVQTGKMLHVKLIRGNMKPY